jgi:alpha-ketoglutarate-dependent taurine dioxygenase
MDFFEAHFADIRDSSQQPHIAALLREEGLVTFSGITDRMTLTAAERLMTIRPHRDAGPDGVTVITDTQSANPGYAAFTDAELIPHTDGSSVPDPPGLLLLACQQPASEGGATLVADGARITGALAAQHRTALQALSAPRAAFFGSTAGHLRPIFEPTGTGRTSLRLRLDNLAWFSSDAAAAVPLLRTAIAQHVQTFRLRRGEGLILSNTRWLHGRERYAGHRIMLRILGDPLPSTGVMPGFRSPAPGAQASRAA